MKANILFLFFSLLLTNHFFGQTAQDWFKKGIILTENLEYVAAVKAFSSAIDINYIPLIDAYIERGNAYMRIGGETYVNQALDDYKKATILESTSYKGYLQQARAYYYLGEYEKSITLFGKALDYNKTDANIYFERGMAFRYLERNERNLKAAITDFERATLLDSLHWRAYGRMAKAKMDIAFSFTKDNKMAIKLYREAMSDNSKALNIQPDDTLYWNQGCCYGILGDYKQAISCFDKGIEMSPNKPHSYQIYLERGKCKRFMNDFEGAVDDFTTAFNVVKNDTILSSQRTLETFAVLLFTEQRDELLSALNIQIKNNPENDGAYFLRALCKYYELMPVSMLPKMEDLQGENENQIMQNLITQSLDIKYSDAMDVEKALKNIKLTQEIMADINKAININPEQPIYHFQRGLFKLATMDATAIDDFSYYLKTDKKNFIAYLYRGVLYYSKDDYLAAEKDFQQVIKINPKMPLTYLLLGGIKMDALEDYQAALVYFNQAIAIDSTIIKCYAARYWAYLELGMLQEALADLDKVIGAEQGDIDSYLDRLQILLKLQIRYEDVIKDANYLLLHLNNSDDETKAMVFYGRGKAYFEQKSYYQAIKDYEAGQNLEYSFKDRNFSFEDYYELAVKKANETYNKGKQKKKSTK